MRAKHFGWIGNVEDEEKLEAHGVDRFRLSRGRVREYTS
jgi:hypothetical protein